MEYSTVEIEGKEYPFLMGRGALRLYCRKKGLSETKLKDINDIFLEMDLNDQDMMHWFCFKVACSSDGDKFPYSFEQFQEVLDENPYLADKIDQLAEEQRPDVPEGNLQPVKSLNQS